MVKPAWSGMLERIDDCRWRIPAGYKPGMRVPGLIFASERLLESIKLDQALEQVANVATLPGIVRHSLGMPDIHWGYGFPIGGVCATDPEAGGVISPGGIGFDINCGVRLLRTNLVESDVRPRLRELVTALFGKVPSGVGSTGTFRIERGKRNAVLLDGARWVIAQGRGAPEDIAHTEEQGAIDGADPDEVSARAFERGRDQLGTLGSGNHFLEVQVVDQVYDERLAAVFSLSAGQVTVMIHSGSRGFGYQVCEDFLRVMGEAVRTYGINVPDRQLACAPVSSPEARRYLGAMRCAANYAWANRQCLMHQAREAFEQVFGQPWRALGMSLIYDVAHNIAKFEEYPTNGGCPKRLCVHRKGATRAFPAGHPSLPEDYRPVGQPVIIPGDMGRNSYLLVGADGAIEESFGTTCHGAGRLMSRSGAQRDERARGLVQRLEAQGILVMARGRGLLAEEAPYAYKDVNEVVDVVHTAGLSRRVCRMRPMGVIKG